MTPATINFLTRNNEAWTEGFKLSLSDGTGFSFADYSPLRMQVKVTPAHPVVELDLTEGSGIAVDLDGGLTIDVPLASVADLLGDYSHDIIGTVAAELVVIAQGIVTFEQGTTYTWP